MVNIIKQEIEIEESLKKKFEFICGFCNTTLTIINGNIRKIEYHLMFPNGLLNESFISEYLSYSPATSSTYSAYGTSKVLIQTSFLYIIANKYKHSIDRIINKK